jgi:hypothetical protein
MRHGRRRLYLRQDISIVDDDRCGDLYCETCSNRLPRMYQDKRESRWRGYFPEPPKVREP